jgi:hypothetical protein
MRSPNCSNRSALAAIVLQARASTRTARSGSRSIRRLSGVWQLTDRLRIRSSVARAFRVPTFTELYYHDPANLARQDLKPEYGWSLDGGIEWTQSGWTSGATPFVRWDHDVIDWVRASPAELVANNEPPRRDIPGCGVQRDASLERALVRGHVSLLDVNAPSVNTLSKYVLEVREAVCGRHGVRALRPRSSRCRDDRLPPSRRRPEVHARWGQGRVHGQASGVVRGWNNLLNESYHEIAGVSMPGRWLTIGLTFRMTVATRGAPVCCYDAVTASLPALVGAGAHTRKGDRATRIPEQRSKGSAHECSGPDFAILDVFCDAFADYPSCDTSSVRMDTRRRVSGS